MVTYSIIKKSQLEGAKRLDAEFYCVSNQIKGDFVLGKDAVEFVQYGTSKELNEEKKGFPVLRLNEFDELFITIPEKYCDKISKEVFEDLKLKTGDVLICRTNGNPKLVGKSAVVLEDAQIAFASYLFRVRPKREVISSETLVTFLNSKIGRAQIEKFLMPSIQSNFSPTQFRAIKIPVLPKEIQKKIDNSVQKSYLLKNESVSLYSQAENLLLKELGLKDFNEEAGLWSIVNLSETKRAGRIDAEYFQPKYEKLISKINSKDSEILETFIKTYSTGFPFQSENYQETGIPLIRINNIQKGYLDLSNSAYLTEKDYLLSPKDVAKSGDIVLSMSGSIGMTALVPKDIPKSIINQRILRITPQNIEKDYLVLLLNSIVGSYQLERIGTGGLQTNISYKDIKNILIPILPKPIQQKISELIQKSHESRKKAKELLEEAKRKVEELIENNHK